MAKMPKPLPVTVTKFDETGNPVAQEVVTPLPDYKKRMLGLVVPKKDEWMPDEVQCDIRVMGKLKKGGTTVLGYAHKWNVDEKVAQFNKRVDLELVYTEAYTVTNELSDEEKAIKELHDRRMAAAYPKASSGSTDGKGRKMVDSDAYQVKFGTLRNLKTGEAAKALGLTYGQVYSARNGYTFTHVTEK